MPTLPYTSLARRAPNEEPIFSSDLCLSYNHCMYVLPLVTIGGKRVAFESANIKVASDVWHTLTAATGLVTAVIAGLLGCSSKEQGVIVYVSEDQVFSEPILRDFERDTGIHAMAVYDTEEAKSIGVMNRLLAEKNNPQADVY
jgi:hypothetical protein